MIIRLENMGDKAAKQEVASFNAILHYDVMDPKNAAV